MAGRVAAVLAAVMLAVCPRVALGAAADRRLADVLLELRASGLDILFSEDLVRPEMRAPAVTRARLPRAVLDEVLAPHGLQARRGPGGRLLVVKADPPDRPSKPRVASPSSELRLLIRLAGAAPPAGLGVSIPERALMLHTEADGSVTLPVAPGLYRLDARLPGHHAWSQDGISVAPGEAHEVTVALDVDPAAVDPPVPGEVILTLSARDRYEDSVEVRSPLGSTTEGGARELPVADVKATAGALENVFRTLPLLPGVTPANEVQSRFSVRGGAGPEPHGARRRGDLQPVPPRRRREQLPSGDDRHLRAVDRFHQRPPRRPPLLGAGGAEPQRRPAAAADGDGCRQPLRCQRGAGGPPAWQPRSPPGSWPHGGRTTTWWRSASWRRTCRGSRTSSST